MLGIIIGVASVITMLAIGQGSKRSIQTQIAEMGSNMIMIHPGGDMRGGVRRDASEMQTLKLENYEKLRDESNYLAGISPNVSSSGQLVYGNNNYPSSVNGVGLDYLSIRQLTIENGEMFTEADIQSSAKVCIIGKTIVDNLFPDGSDPVGRVIRFGKIPFRVVGVLKSKGYNSMGMDQDDIVLAPYTTVMKRLLAVTYLQGIYASALSEDMTDYATEEITRILRREHKLKDSDEDDFTILSLHCRHFSGSRRYRHYEYHVCICYRTHTGDRSSHVSRCTWNRYPQPIPYRSHSDQYHRRYHRSHYRLRCQLDCKKCSPLAYLYTALECFPIVCRMYHYRCIFRMVSG